MLNLQLRIHFIARVLGKIELLKLQSDEVNLRLEFINAPIMLL